jgi:hypothetical protein
MVIPPASLRADELAIPFSFGTLSAQKNYVFVMIAPVNKESDGSGLKDKDRIDAQRLRAKYRTSGLYANDGSTTPLWTVDWYAYSVLVPSDGIHLIRQGPWAHDRSTEAITFIAAGKTLRSYRVADLVDTTITLPHTVSHFQWAKSTVIDDASRTVTITTLNRDRYVIDFSTGNIISATRPLRISAITFAGLLLLMTAFLIRLKRRIRMLHLPPRS